MDQEIRIFKFGGASLQSAEGVENVAEILLESKENRICIVVSAMGKMTNALEVLTHAYYHRNPHVSELLGEIKSFHVGIAKRLFGPDDEVWTLINDHFVEIEWVLEEEPHPDFGYVYDQIIPVGEFLSSQILYRYLRTKGISVAWLDARDVILTDNTYREGRVRWQETQSRIRAVVPPLLESSGYVLTQGFIGCTSENFTTTLGREGSDYTAAIFANALDAVELSVWKDVSGIMSADPKRFVNPVKIDRMTYREAIEMTYYGAKVIHPKTIKPVQNKMIPLRVRSFRDVDEAGTLIGSEIDPVLPPIIIEKDNQALLHISTKDYSFVVEEHLRQLFDLFVQHRIKVNLMRNTAISFTICTDLIDERIDALVRDLNKRFHCLLDRDLELLTIRHYNDQTLKTLTEDKIVLFEERFKETIQLVMKSAPVLKKKSKIEP